MKLNKGMEGVVFGTDGIGLAETAVMVFEREASGRHGLMGIGSTAENGEYRLRFSAAGGEDAYCCFFKDGYEPGFRELGRLEMEEDFVQDAILHHAVSMSFEIKNKLGFSLPGLGVRITAAEDHLYPITYATNSNGTVHTQTIFRDEGRYQLTVLAGGIELHVEKFLAQGSRALEIRIPLPHVRNPGLRKSASN
jgi:hypothetical protein